MQKTFNLEITGLIYLKKSGRERQRENTFWIVERYKSDKLKAGFEISPKCKFPPRLHRGGHFGTLFEPCTIVALYCLTDYLIVLHPH